MNRLRMLVVPARVTGLALWVTGVAPGVGLGLVVTSLLGGWLPSALHRRERRRGALVA